MKPHKNSEVTDWVIAHFLPFEAEFRVLLRRVCASPSEIDDVIQEVYYKVLQLDSVAHVQQARAFLVSIAKNIVVDRMRRDAIVSIEAMANLEDLDMESHLPTPERVVQARSELNWVYDLIDNLPERCRAVFRSRRLYGLSQQETAAALGMSEGMVEQETIKGMERISQVLAEHGLDDAYPQMRARTNKRVAKQTGSKESNDNDR